MIEYDTNGKPLIKCHHGKLPYTGQIQCAEKLGGCGRVWHLMDPSKSPSEELGENCVCGGWLRAGGTALAICPVCFEERWNSQEGEES